MKSQKDTFFFFTETARWEPPRKAAYSEHSISKAGYVTALLAIVHTELRAWAASIFFFLCVCVICKEYYS